MKSASNLPYFNWMFLFQFANICYLNFSQQYLYERFSQVCSLGNNRTPNELSSASTPSDFSQQRGAIVKFEIKLSFICCINGLHASCIIDPYHCANTGSLCWSADILPILLSYLPTSYTLKYWCHTILWVWMFVIVNWSPGYCTQTGIAFPVPLLYCVCVQSDVTTFPFSKSHKCSFSNACYLKSYGLKQIWTYWSNASFFLPFQWDSRDCIVFVLTEEPVLMWPVSKMVFQLYFIPQSPDMAAWQNDYLQVNPWDLWTFSSFNERVYFKIIKKMLI